MINNKTLIVFLLSLFLIVVPQTFAAEITGYVYDYSLEVVNDVVLTIDSNPKQQIISKDGSYSFIIGKGEYTLTAIYQKNNRIKYSTEEKINITDDGKYNLDIILFPYLDDDYDLSDDLELNINEVTDMDKTSYWFIIPLAIIIVAIFFAIYWFFVRSKPKKTINYGNVY